MIKRSSKAVQQEQASSEHTASATDNDAAVEVQNLVKHYARTEVNAVDGISFTVQRGEIFGLLGPNGAGKTTTISMLTTGALPTSGSIRVMGSDVAENPVRARQHIALVPQKSNLDKRLRARELLIFHASYHAVPRAEREARANMLLAELGLTDHSKDDVNHFSGGMEQRLMFARALMHTPSVLILDEPTNSLDPQSRLFLWEHIHLLNSQGLTVVLTTHDMDEAEQLCHRIAIMDKGRIVALDRTDELKKLVPGGTKLELHVRPAEADTISYDAQPSLLEALQALNGVTTVEASLQHEEQQDIIRYRLYTEDVETLIPAVVQAVSSTGATLRNIHLSHPSLEDVFIALTGRNLRS